MYHDFYNLRAGDLVWLAPKPEHPATTEAFADLREFFGPETIDPILAGSWTFVERVSAAGRAHPAGASARLRGPGDYELTVARRRVTCREAYRLTRKGREAALELLRLGERREPATREALEVLLRMLDPPVAEAEALRRHYAEAVVRG